MKELLEIDSNWINHHWDLLEKHQGKWIAYNQWDGVIASKVTLDDAEQEAKKHATRFSLFFVNPLFYKGIRFLPIRFKAIKFHSWQPIKSVTLSVGTQSIEVDMLVDSGADCSIITYDTGQKLGLSLSKAESIFQAEGIGVGKINFVKRDIEFKINDQIIIVPTAWVQTKECTDEIIGREVVFDKFDIEFQQRNEIILFKPAPDISF